MKSFKLPTNTTSPWSLQEFDISNTNSKSNVLLIGSGGREHALAWKLTQSSLLDTLFVAPGSAAIAKLPLTQCVDISADRLGDLVNFAKTNEIDLVVIGPEKPLAEGLADQLQSKGIDVFGPTQAGAKLESSKIFAKNIMSEAGIPTAGFHIFDDHKAMLKHLEEASYPLVIKADGLAAGKGVMVCKNKQEAIDFGNMIFRDKKFGDAGNQVLIEECLVGRECSILGVTDGTTVELLDSAQDHKRLLDQDQGPNTGGMGAYSPSPICTEQVKQDIKDRVFTPLLATLNKKGIDFCGVIYAGIMMTKDGPYVLEFNVRFGDPETQVILPRMESDILELFFSSVRGTLDTHQTKWTNQSAITIVMASGGYPESSQKGVPIEGIEEVPDSSIVFHAGTKQEHDQWQTNGGRVLCVTTMGDSVVSARASGYQALSKISFDQAHYRTDIGLDGTKSM